jgi:hypothetical protein
MAAAMSAAEVAAALNGKREGRTWRCRCPLCGRRTLDVRDGDRQVLVTCWVCGEQRRFEVLAELRRLGHLEPRAHPLRPAYHFNDEAERERRDVAKRKQRTEYALSIWNCSLRGDGSPAAVYLASRGIKLETWPPSLRFHPRCPQPNGTPLPAMVALAEHVERGAIGIHRTFLRPDGSGKADVPKDQQRASLGPIRGGAVWFGTPKPGDLFAAGEGIESVLSVVVSRRMAACAALSAGGLESLILPPVVTDVVIAGDNDASGTGQRAAQTAGKRFLSEGRSVKIALPPIPDTDFNSMIIGANNE